MAFDNTSQGKGEVPSKDALTAHPLSDAAEGNTRREESSASTVGESAESSGRTTSQKQIDANRRNAKRSRGPRTEAGKARSSVNATKHGVFARPIAIPRGLYRENPEAVAEGMHEIVAALAPNNALAEAAAWEIARIFLSMTRLAKLEAELIAGAARAPDPDELGPSYSAMEQLAALFDTDPRDFSARHWIELALYLADELEDGEVRALGDPELDGPTLPDGDPRWQSIANDLFERSGKWPPQLARELRARASRGRRASEQRRRIEREESTERGAAALFSDGSLEKCSLIRARLSRELDRALTHFHEMQKLGG